MGGVYRRPPMDARLDADRRLAALRAAPPDGAPRAAHADRRRAGRAPRGRARRASTRPTRCRSASPGRRSRARRSSAASCSTTGGTRATLSPEHWFLNLMVELGRPADRRPVGRRGRSSPILPHRRHRVVAGPRVPGTRASARRCAPRCSGFAFDGLGARVAETSAFLDNAAVERGVARARLRGERVRQPGARGRRPRRPSASG